MKRVLSGMPVGIKVMALTGLALVAGAQSTSASQLNLIPILQISGQYSDNVFFSEANKRSDTFFLVNPGIALDYASRNFVGSFAYQVGLQRYVDFDARDNDVHRFDATAGFNLSKGWYIDASDNLYVTNDPLAFDASGDRVQRDSFTYNRFVPAISYHFGGSRDFRLGARYDRVDIDYDTLIDSIQNGFGANIAAKLGSRSTLAFDYFDFKREFDQQAPQFNVIDYTGRRYSGSVDYRISSRVSVNLLGGYEEREFEVQPETRNFDSWIADVSLTGEFPEVFSWTIGGSRRLNDLAIRGAYKIDRLNFDVRKTLADRLRLEFAGFAQHSDNDQIAEEADYFGVRFEGQYMVAKFLNLWLGYEYLDRDSDQLNPFTENRVNFGLTVSYGL